MTMGDYLRKGYLLKCPQKARAFKKWNSRWFVLYGNSARGRVRLEYYDNEKTWQLEKGKRIIPLVHCVSIKPVWNKDYNNVLEIVTSDKTFYLGAGNKDEEKAWFKSLCKVVFGNANRNSIVHVIERPDAFDIGYSSLDRAAEIDSNLSRSQSSTLAQSSPQLSKIMGSREKLSLNTTGNSDLNITISSMDMTPRNAASSMSGEISSLVSFESGFDDSASVISSVTEAVHRYNVTVRPTIASQEAGMTGQYVLQITPATLTLQEAASDNIAAEWQIQHLRRYGRGRTKFSFEAGDKCQSGIGVYTFNTMEGDQIFHLVDMYARKISSLQRKDHKDKRISMPGETFKPLSETRQRAKSEGRLIDSTDDLTVKEFTDTLGYMPVKGLSAAQSSFPSKNRACTLDVIKDNEGAEKQGSLNAFQRPRSRTDVSVEKDAARRIQATQDQKPMGESMESLLQNPANSDLKSGLEAAKARVDDDSVDKKNGGDFQRRVENVDDIREEKETCIERKSEDELFKDMEKNVLNKSEDLLVKNEMEVEGSKNEEQTNLEISEQKGNIGPSLNIEPANVDATNGQTTISEKLENEQTDVYKKLGNGNVHSDTKAIVEEGVDQRDGPAKTGNTEVSSHETKEDLPAEVEKQDFSKRRKLRKLAQRNKSFEFGSISEKASDNKKHSGSFSSFDYRKYRDNNEPVYKTENGPRKLQRFASVMRTVEMYEKISTAATDARQKSYTLWKRKSLRSSQKPEVTKRANDSNM